MDVTEIRENARKNFLPKTRKNKKLDYKKRKHKSQYNSTISLNNSNHNKNIFI